MKPMTVARMIQMLQGLIRDQHINPEYRIAIWVPDGSGSEAIDILDAYPEEDHNETIIGFKLDIK